MRWESVRAAHEMRGNGDLSFLMEESWNGVRMYADRAECSAERGDSLCMHISTPVYRPKGIFCGDGVREE